MKRSIIAWIREHDEKWLFVAVYLGLAVGLSVLVSLFWLLVVALAHFALECIRQGHLRRGAADTVLHALWEIKLDVALVILALTLVLYIDVVLGVLGVQSAARAAAVTRAGARIGTRAAAWERNLRTFLLTADEMFRVGYAGVMLRRKARRAGAVAEDEGDRGKERDGAAGAVASPPDGDTSQIGPGAESADREGLEASAEVERERGRAGGTGGSTPPVWRRRWRLGDRVSVALGASGVILILAAPLLTPHDGASAIHSLLEELRPFP